jgi:hypothetical protein
VAEASADADALSTQVQLYHSAAQIGITDTAARSDTVMKKHNALARRLLDHRRQARQASCPPPTASRRGV